MINQLKRRVMGMIGRAVIEAVDDMRLLQAVQASGQADELHDGIERFQNYGLTSHPHAGAEAMMVHVGGTRSHGVIIAVDDRRYRLKALEAGEVALYDDLGQVVHLMRDGIRLSSDQKVTVEAPEVVVEAETVHLGGEGGPAVARVGDSVAGGVITSGSATVFAA